MQRTFPTLYNLLFCLEWEAAKLFLCLVFDDHPSLDLGLKGALLPAGADSCAESQPSSLLTPFSYPDSCSVCTGRFLCSSPAVVLGAWGPSDFLALGRRVLNPMSCLGFLPCWGEAPSPVAFWETSVLGKCFESLSMQTFALPPSHLIDGLVGNSCPSGWEVVAHCLRLTEWLRDVRVVSPLSFTWGHFHLWNNSIFFSSLGCTGVGLSSHGGTQWVLSYWRLTIVIGTFSFIIFYLPSTPQVYFLFSFLDLPIFQVWASWADSLIFLRFLSYFPSSSLCSVFGSCLLNFLSKLLLCSCFGYLPI